LIQYGDFLHSIQYSVLNQSALTARGLKRFTLLAGIELIAWLKYRADNLKNKDGLLHLIEVDS
jgi:hypothetical protein